MPAPEPDVEGWLVKVDDLQLDQVARLRGNVLHEVLRQLLDANDLEEEEVVAAFGNYI
jgi:FXSXX-COOH protein